MKICFKCNKEKELSLFYKHRQMKDGHLNKCKDCAKADAHKHRDDNLEKVKKYDRNRPNAIERNERFKLAEKERRKDPEFKVARNAIKKNWADKNLIKRAAHIISRNAVRDGKLIKQPCEVCGELKVDGHHDDYEKPLEVRWLCRKHHAEHHKKERELKRQEAVC